ncbi:uncharacterized protein I303_106846 [Kwoniella dejecticola CBS 10117]|uniref:CASTOR ACT domain-containing protein n=1 Tax=Kwoniella dejecticola CBS 10117 TaxID=1296121 RepID=A0A1A5ZTN5_9TREE|nr:uncharacterized protein I303_08513 [Kwoniella dejecticola CBS 10117]OBR81130.1 hypothetical protein I303_08513 [Kwoniella dejecticola CBS 10117]
MSSSSSSTINKIISVLHLIPQPWPIHTFFYPLSIAPQITSDMYEKYPFFSVNREPDGISVVAALPPGEEGVIVDGEVRNLVELGPGDAGRWFGPWRAVKIRGPLYIGLTGILHEFLTPLRKAEINIYALSTWPTDYILVPAQKLEKALSVLKEDGWHVVEPNHQTDSISLH